MRRPKYYIQKNMKIWGDLKEVIIRNTGNHTVWQSGQKQLECERAVHEDDHQTSFSSVWWLKMRISVHGAHNDDQHRLQIENTTTAHVRDSYLKFVMKKRWRHF